MLQKEAVLRRGTLYAAERSSIKTRDAICVWTGWRGELAVGLAQSWVPLCLWQRDGP